MDEKKAEMWLKASFLAGAVTDALALAPMLFDVIARLFWGFTNVSLQYIFAMRLAAVFMLAWTLLLFWAWRKPMERRFAAPLTVWIIVGFFSLELWAVKNGIMTMEKALPSMILQVLLTTLFSFSSILAFGAGRRKKESR